MNKKQIENRIKLEASKVVVPDLKSQILANVENRQVHIKEPKKRFNFAVRFSYLTTFVILIFMLVIIINSNENNVGSNNKEEGQLIEVTNVKAAYAKQAAILASFVNSSDIYDDVETMSYTTVAQQEEDYSTIANQINAYFSVVSKLLAEEDAVYELYSLNSGEYQYKLSVVNTILDDSCKTIIYYNETAKSNHDKDDLDEVSTTLSGIIEQDNNSFTFFGIKEVSSEECEIDLTIKINDNCFIEVEQEIEGDEKSLEYKFYYGDPRLNYEAKKSVYIDIEEEKDTGKKQVNVKIDNKYDIYFKYDKHSDRNHVDVDYHDREENKSYNGIKIEEDEDQKDYYRYDFNDGKDHYSFEKPHGNKGHDKDDRDGKDKR